MAEVQLAQVTVQRAGALAWVTLSNPARLNAMSRAMWRQLAQVFAELQQASDVRCVVLRGTGGNFCAGGDIAQYPAFRFDEVALAHFHEQEVWGALHAILSCDVPVLAAIEGVCMGAGVEIASCCDLRLAARSVRFGAPIARLGFPMAPREAALVTRALGPTVARAMLLAAELYSADDLLATGFLTRVWPDAELEAAALAMAQRVAALAPQAARLNKQTLRCLLDGDTPPHPYGYAPSPEHREGVTAFLEKRAPEF